MIHSLLGIASIWLTGLANFIRILAIACTSSKMKKNLIDL